MEIGKDVELTFDKPEGMVVGMLITAMMALINGDPLAAAMISNVARSMELASQLNKTVNGRTFDQTVESIVAKVTVFVNDSTPKLILGSDLD